MKFKNYLCWSPKKVHEIINPDADAEAVSEEIFLAVHTDYPLLFSNSPNRDVSPDYIDADDFLNKKFLNNDFGNYVQTIVLGESGSGKSHFIKWMSLHMPKKDDTYVFTIPKARTSLRNIIERIVDLLPPDLAQPYYQQLQNSDPITLNERGKFDKLLSSLALAISQDSPLQYNDNEATDLEEYLIASLPYLFEDPYLRKSYFTNNHPLVSSLVNHVFSNHSINIQAESRREFTAIDIDLGGHDYGKAAVPTQDVLDVISSGSKEFDLALKIINRNLDKALTLTLSLTPQQLIDMMTDLRKHLYTQGKRLILLVEDLALLQGIDNALLQALTIPSLQGNERLCELRWAAAVTTGYYSELEKTVRTRLTFRIEMDRPASEAKAGLAKFAARYLNAVRIGPERLKKWYQELYFYDKSAAIPNACTECQYQNVCHEGFGTAEDYGLYPFNIEALWNMARRTNKTMEQVFLPRTFLNEVLRNTLFIHAEFLNNGLFPSKKLLVGPYELSLNDWQKMEEIDPINHSRRLTLLELWNGDEQKQIVSLNSINLIVYDAFSLPFVEIEKQVGKSKVIEPPPGPRPLPINADFEQIDLWAKNHETKEEMQQTLSTKLRKALFETLLDYINWDELSIDRSSIASQTGAKPFTNLTFCFRGQTTSTSTQNIFILIPQEDQSSDFTKTAIALKGLLQFRGFGHWDFPNGDIALFNFLECLKEWSENITQQIKNLSELSENWDAGKATVELLAIARSLTSNKILNLSSIISPEPLSNTLFISNDLIKLTERLSKDQKNLQKLVQAIYSLKKGGRKGNFINPDAILETLENLKKNKWQLKQSPPENLSNPYRLVANLYSRIKLDLDKAITSEINARKAWYARVIPHFTLGETDKDVNESVAKTRDVMNKLGIPGWDVVDFENIQDKFRRSRLSQLIKNNAFNENIEGNEVLLSIASTQKDKMDDVDTFIQKIEPMLKKGEQGLESRCTQYSADIKPLADVQRRIETAFTTLNTLLEAIQ